MHLFILRIFFLLNIDQHDDDKQMHNFIEQERKLYNSRTLAGRKNLNVNKSEAGRIAISLKIASLRTS